MPSPPEPDERRQIDKFRDLARELGADEDETRWDARLKKVAAHKPVPEPENPE